MNNLRHFLSICIHCIVAVLFLVGSFGLRAEQLCDVENPCADSEVASCCVHEKVEQTTSKADCCTTPHSDDEEQEHEKSHKNEHLCQCCTVTKNLIAPVNYSDNEIGIKINLNPGDLNSYFTLLLISKPFHPPNSLSIS